MAGSAPPEQLPTMVAVLVGRVAELLGVPTRPVRVRLARNATGHASTCLRRPPEAPVVTVSPDMLRLSVLGHEVTHCLVPTPWLFLGEGLATWVATELSGNCADLFFSAASLEEVLARSWRVRPPPVSELVRARVDAPGKLDPAGFPGLEMRLALAVAGSFCGHWQRRRPGLAALAGQATDLDPCQLLLQASGGVRLDDMERAWRSWLAAEGSA